MCQRDAQCHGWLVLRSFSKTKFPLSRTLDRCCDQLLLSRNIIAPQCCNGKCQHSSVKGMCFIAAAYRFAESAGDSAALGRVRQGAVISAVAVGHRREALAVFFIGCFSSSFMSWLCCSFPY